MGKTWTGHSSYGQLTGELATSEGRNFERKILPFIRLTWPSAVGSPELLSFDQAGIDHLAWSDKSPHTLVVQCKGFKVGEHEIGRSQITQCLNSIDSFRKSGVKTKQYLLIHNRDGRNAEFRDTIEAALAELVQTGQATHAELWDRQRLLQKTFDAMLKVALWGFSQKNLSKAAFHAEGEPVVDFVTDVPMTSSTLVVDQYKLHSTSSDAPRLSDPAIELFSNAAAAPPIRLLTGEAGYGKTTAVYRAIKPHAQLLYVPAASIPGSIMSSNDLLQCCIDTTTMLDNFAAEDQPSLARLLPPVIHYLFKEGQIPIILILDGLDESIFFSRRGGIQWLFNMLREVRVPVVMLARTEFWNARQQDFATAFGDPARKSNSLRRQEIRLFELLPWTDRQILLLTERYRDSLTDSEKRERIQRLIHSVQSGEYTKFYGDIPRRPLFLRFILDTVAENDQHRVDRFSLFEEWARLKILRDMQRPFQWGSWGRAPIVSSSEGAGTTLDLAFAAMIIAARKMTRIQDGQLELWPNCEIEEILMENRRLACVTDPLGLFLNSLIVPTGALGLGKQQVRFAHRAFQEFFLARDIREQPQNYKNIKIPNSVLDWGIA